MARKTKQEMSEFEKEALALLREIRDKQQVHYHTYSYPYWQYIPYQPHYTYGQWHNGTAQNVQITPQWAQGQQSQCNNVPFVTGLTVANNGYVGTTTNADAPFTPT